MAGTKPTSGRSLPGATQLRTPERIRVRLHLFPSDNALARDVERVWSRLVSDRNDDETFRRDLECDLQRWYPRLVIQAQHDLASLVQEEEVWYVFRDGRIRPTRQVRDRFYEAMSTARQTTEELEATLRDANAIAARAGRRRSAGGLKSGPISSEA